MIRYKRLRYIPYWSMKAPMRFILFTLCFAGLITAVSVRAETAGDNTLAVLESCERAKTTADIMNCVKKRHDDAQQELTTLYQGIADALDDESLDSLRTAQKDWITYRDQQCALRVSQAEHESLKRVQELSCLTQLTRDRIRILTFLTSKTPARPPEELSAFPRWLNVIADENPDIYWKHSGRLHEDIDCDGVYEEVMSGLMVEPGTDNLLHPVISIVNNPPTGKPQTHMIIFDVTEEETPGALCKTHIDIRIIDESVPGETVTADGTDTAEPQASAACRKAVRIDHGDCPPLLIFPSGSDFESALEPPWASAAEASQ